MLSFKGSTFIMLNVDTKRNWVSKKSAIAARCSNVFINYIHFARY